MGRALLPALVFLSGGRRGTTQFLRDDTVFVLGPDGRPASTPGGTLVTVEGDGPEVEKLAETAPTPGDEVIVLGYPAGMQALVARARASVAEELLAQGAVDFWALASGLSQRGLIAPLAAQGIVGQVTGERRSFTMQKPPTVAAVAPCSASTARSSRSTRRSSRSSGAPTSGFRLPKRAGSSTPNPPNENCSLTSPPFCGPSFKRMVG